MPEPAAWRYQKITKPMFDTPFAEVTLAGRIIPMTGGVIENGHVTINGGKITAVGEGAPAGAQPYFLYGEHLRAQIGLRSSL